MRKILPALLAVAVLILSFGCGNAGELSLDEYRKSIADLHDGVASDLGYAFERLSILEHDDYFDLIELQEVYEEAHEVFSLALDEAISMKPPPKTESLHADLVHFYLKGTLETQVMVDASRFLEAVLPMLVDMENLALPQVAGDAGAPAIQAASTEDRKTLQGYMKDLKGMRPPMELQDYREDLTDFFQSMDESIGRLEQEIALGDNAPLELFKQEYSAELEMVNGFWEEAMDYLDRPGSRVDLLIEKGKELAERIHELQAVPSRRGMELARGGRDHLFSGSSKP